MSFSRLAILFVGLLLSSASHLAHADVTFVHTDHLGTPVAYSDAQGNVMGEESTTPFGESLNPPTSDDLPAFTGHVRDGSTGLVYMQARYYDPVVGRFLSTDPVGFEEGGTGYFNRYSYVSNNPMNRIDPTGTVIENPGTLDDPDDDDGDGCTVRNHEACDGLPDVLIIYKNNEDKESTSKPSDLPRKDEETVSSESNEGFWSFLKKLNDFIIGKVESTRFEYCAEITRCSDGSFAAKVGTVEAHVGCVNGGAAMCPNGTKGDDTGFSIHGHPPVSGWRVNRNDLLFRGDLTLNSSNVAGKIRRGQFSERDLNNGRSDILALPQGHRAEHPGILKEIFGPPPE